MLDKKQSLTTVLLIQIFAINIVSSKYPSKHDVCTKSVYIWHPSAVQYSETKHMAISEKTASLDENIV